MEIKPCKALKVNIYCIKTYNDERLDDRLFFHISDRETGIIYTHARPCLLTLSLSLYIYIYIYIYIFIKSH